MNIYEKQQLIKSMNISDGFLNVIKCANSFYANDSSRRLCIPFIVQGFKVGFIKPEVADMMKEYPDVFQVDKHQVKFAKKVDYDSIRRTEAIDQVLTKWKMHGCFESILKGWRDEIYTVSNDFHTDPLFEMERCAASLFGVIQRGVHVNGFTFHPQNGLSMWIATRSLTKQTWPGHLDQMVGGGLAARQSVLECAIKECNEEANIDALMFKYAIPSGTVSYAFENELGIWPEEQFVYDLKLPLDFIPENTDGEVAKFELLSIEKVALLASQLKFTPTSGLVVVDFLVRHGILNADDEKHYTNIVRGLHSPIAFDGVHF